jgi:large subunit ribosomal protein L23
MENILQRPLITEKMTSDSEKNNRYGFVVSKSANKIQIRQAVEKQYNVKVTSVRTVNVDGKVRSRFTKTGMITGRTASYKKAIVQLADGNIIDFYENI